MKTINKIIITGIILITGLVISVSTVSASGRGITSWLGHGINNIFNGFKIDRNSNTPTKLDVHNKCRTVTNQTTNTDYFVPTKTSGEWNYFLTNLPNNVTSNLCPIDGGWSAFGVYRACSASCGGGYKYRYRSCNNPTPANGGASCVGSYYQRASCNTQHCPVRGSCKNSIRNGCYAGRSNDGAVSDTSTYYRWRCDGQYGGSNSGICSKAKPLRSCRTADGVTIAHGAIRTLYNPTHNSCAATSTAKCYNGTLTAGVPVASPGPDIHKWYTTTAACNATRSPINGVCKEYALSSYACLYGRPNDEAVPDTTTYDRWRCDGLYGGSNSRNCQKLKPFTRGRCNHSIRNGCYSGRANDRAVPDTSTYYKWRCYSSYTGGEKSSICSKRKTASSGTSTGGGQAATKVCNGTLLSYPGGSGSTLSKSYFTSYSDGRVTIRNTKYNVKHSPSSGTKIKNLNINSLSIGSCTPYELTWTGRFKSNSTTFKTYFRYCRKSTNSIQIQHNVKFNGSSAWSNPPGEETIHGSVDIKQCKDVTIPAQCGTTNTKYSCKRGTAIHKQPTRWLCQGGNTSKWCTYNAATKVNGRCNNNIRNGCYAGRANDAAYPDDSSTYYWRCDGLNGGRNSGPKWCYKRKGVIGGYSDKRLKKDIAPITNALSKIEQLNGVSYDWKDSLYGTKREIGVIAQDVEKVFPELVQEDENGIKMVNYSHLTAILIEAIKEQQIQIEELKKENFEIRKIIWKKMKK